MSKQNLFEEFDDLSNDDLMCDCYKELKDAAWSILYENPGTEFGDWQDMLLEQFPAEVVDALGSNPNDVYPALADLWDSTDYEDPRTGECHTFQEWAEYFATDRSIELYDLLSEARRDIKRLEALKIQNQPNPQSRIQNPVEGYF